MAIGQLRQHPMRHLEKLSLYPTPRIEFLVNGPRGILYYASFNGLAILTVKRSSCPIGA